MADDDTDRIIAAQRVEAEKTRAAQAAQAHKTRVMLAWIFLGVPFCAAAIGLLVLVLISAAREAGTGPDTDDPAPTVAVTGAPLTLYSTCQDLMTEGDLTSALQSVVSQSGTPDDPLLSQYLTDECLGNPQESLGLALGNAQAQEVVDSEAPASP